MTTLLALATAFAVQDDSVGKILEQYRSYRPAEKELAIWRIDWIPDFAKAQSKAEREGRPLIFIWNNNITGPESLYSGHC